MKHRFGGQPLPRMTSLWPAMCPILAKEETPWLYYSKEHKFGQTAADTGGLWNSCRGGNSQDEICQFRELVYQMESVLNDHQRGNFFFLLLGKGRQGYHVSLWHPLFLFVGFFLGGFFHSIWFRNSKTKNGFPQEGGMWVSVGLADFHIQLHRGSNWGELRFAGPSQARAWGPGQWTSPKSGTEAFGLRFGGKKFSQAQQKSFFSFFQTQNGPPNPLIQAAIWTLSSQKCHILHENLSFQHLAHFHFLKSGPNHFLRHFLSWKLRTSHGGHNKNWSWPSLA